MRIYGQSVQKAARFFESYPKNQTIAGLDVKSFYSGIVVVLKCISRMGKGEIYIQKERDNMHPMQILSANEILAKVVTGVTERCFDHVEFCLPDEIADILDNDRHEFL